MLALERKRTERSHHRFVLMLLESASLFSGGEKAQLIEKVLHALGHSTRETDVKGWYKTESVMGVVFTELGLAEGKPVADALLAKTSEALGRALSLEQINEIRLSFHFFPEDQENDRSGGMLDPALYPDLMRTPDPKKSARLLKRVMDVAGSISALALLSPVLAVIAVAIRLTSKGPILFRQTRIGQYGRRFTFLKFRSMYSNSDHAVHQEYVKLLISGETGSRQQAESRQNVYKLTNDTRVTRLGRFLRRTSLDELPQLLNVLRGEMSLVGPRPPIPYEFQSYAIWHRRRLLSVKPGITGLWQVEGRSRVKFDDMVRLDLAYAASWSPWMDVKILFRTPRAVFSGEGAY
jgi:Sugar transferases involved in lipopolysaccharide synthesis